MDTTIRNIVELEIRKYAVEGLNSITYMTENELQGVFTTVTLYKDEENPRPMIDLFVRLLPDTIIIEEDRNSKPLYEALIQAGIPREKIILAYAGEKIPNLSS